MENFSSYFGMSIQGHQDIAFVDIPVDTDVKLFLDPSLIEAGKDSFSEWCATGVSSFFGAVFQACADRNINALRALLAHSAEPNESHLGLSMRKSQGRGASEEILFPIFEGLIAQGAFVKGTITSPNDICVLAPNFDQDRMSDLLTNILRNQLFEFTIAQCEKHNIPLDGIRQGYCWEESSGIWMPRRWNCPTAYGRPVLLVPKEFVVCNYHMGVDSYISQYLLTYLQRQHLINHTSACHRRKLKDGREKWLPPKKVELRRTELVGASQKHFAMTFACEHPETLPQFNHMRKERFCKEGFALSDQTLNRILYVERQKYA